MAVHAVIYDFFSYLRLIVCRINFKTIDKMKEQVSKKFQELYGEGAVLFASPERINLIGEHTDYIGGFVFPGAVD